MISWGLSCLSVLGAAGTTLLCAGLLLGLAQQLWTLRWTLSRDWASTLPLPKGSMGWPFFGETLHWLVQVSGFIIKQCPFPASSIMHSWFSVHLIRFLTKYSGDFENPTCLAVLFFLRDPMSPSFTLILNSFDYNWGCKAGA
jgi:hypothetical protein